MPTKVAPTPLDDMPNRAELERFTKGAQTRETEPATNKKLKLNHQGKPTTGLNLRLNEYELDLIRQLAKAKECSIQKLLRGILIPALEKDRQQPV